ncbi:LacI family DNA-binding transcriptional regulator [Motilibacter aurantiacus]|uniref:LacI family DNA-binding transcriptional regulator n=1 Tax=Motilibacter aurantiacus TaxID=2714955 RepID=UPI0014081D19|nr:LacI family DNA-binding transcriptional regulator [Motilibacter aurantiacus]NHC46686.1 LacI family DNA-binding transcriptional regulator [Motilibacter aurantiacus]
MSAAGSRGRPRSLARAVTLADVAAATGVSHQTVSRVLNDSPAVRPETRERVAAVIEQLGYRPNPAARALATRRSLTLGVVSFDPTLHGPASTVHGIEVAARAAGYFVSVAGLDSPGADGVRRALDRLVGQAVDGVVLIAPFHEAAAAAAELAERVPVVVVGAGGSTGMPCVGVDQVEGARLATAHLLDQGAGTVFHVAGPEGWTESEERADGWRAALEAAGRPVPPVVGGTWRPSAGYEAGRLLAARGDVEGVFVANDQMALGLLRAFGEAGLRVPEDVLVVGFDDVPEAAYYSPPLTTVRQDFARVGRRSIDLLVERLAQGASVPARYDVVPPELVVRSSSVRARTRRAQQGRRAPAEGARSAR